MTRARVFLVASLTGLLAAPSLAAPRPQAQQKPRAKKVWTEDDLIALRTPTDRYLLEKERREEEERAAREAEEAARKAQAAKPQKSESTTEPTGPGVATQIPDRPEEIQKRIDEVRKRVEDLELQQRANDEAALASREDQREEYDTRRQALAKQLDEARAELKALEDKLLELRPPPG